MSTNNSGMLHNNRETAISKEDYDLRCIKWVEVLVSDYSHDLWQEKFDELIRSLCEAGLNGTDSEIRSLGSIDFVCYLKTMARELHKALQGELYEF